MQSQPLLRHLLLAWASLSLTACPGSVSAPPDGGEDADGQDPVDGIDLWDGDLDDGGDAADDASPDGQDGGDDGPPPETDWAAPVKPFRAMVTLLPHPARDRTDLPVLARLAHPGAFIARDVEVFEVSDPARPVAVAAACWSEPGGQVAQVGFDAPGLTPAGESRRFAVYYRALETPEPWSWQDPGWATRQQLPGGLVGVAGGCCGITREVDEAAGRLRSGRRAGQATALTLTAAGWKVAEGFSSGYQLESGATVYPAAVAEAAPYSRLEHDGDGFQAALAAVWEGRSPPEHELSLTHRVFRSWPFVQYLLHARSPTSPLAFSGSDWNARQVFLADDHDRMQADVYPEAPLASVWNTGVRWLVVHDSASGRGFGWFATGRGVLRADPAGGPPTVFDSYGQTAGGGLVFGALWMAAEDKDQIVDLFDAMSPGVSVAAPETRDLNILAPEDGSFWFPEDALAVRVSTPGSTAAVTAEWTLPGGARLAVELARVGNSWVWEAPAPLLLDAGHPSGTWTLTARAGGETREARIEVRAPAHPHLLFSAADLPALRARKDGAHAAIWARMLADAAGYPAPIEDPGPGQDIRGYADRLINLALVQLVDPGQPHEARLREYFFRMLRYPNWTSSERPFNNHDLTVGHFLTALALTYDWHHARLTPEERREVRARLADMADAWLLTGWMRHYPDIDWSHFGSVTNNHYWINNQGVAAAAFALEDEVADGRRQAWVERTEANLAVVLGVLQDDGASNEGVAYHSYGQINLFPWVDMRDRALGGDTARSSPWFQASILWDLYSIAPGGDDNYGGPANFGDCPPYHYNPPRTIQAWLAARLRDGRAQWMAEDLDWPRQTAYSYLWYDPTVPALPPDDLPLGHLAPDRGVFAWRSSWQDDATYFSLKSGAYFGGHEQPDAGHFILHRAGVPYLTDLGYSYWKVADEHNLVLVDGQGQHGQAQQWMGAVDPAHWARTPFLLARGSHFDLLADPTPMMLSAELTGWTREVLGLGPELFLVRDVLAASRPVEFTWLLHGYRTDPPDGPSGTYAYRDRRLENPFAELGAGRWQVRPQDAAPALQLADLSADPWSAALEPTFFVPEQRLDTGGYNESGEPFQLGYRLRRARTAAATTSLVAAWFDQALSSEALSSAEGEGARLADAGGEVAVVVWSLAGAASLGGLSLQGAMGGRRLDEPAYFGRDLTRLEAGGQLLVQASRPVSLHARLEHTASPAAPREALVQASGDATLELFCPAAPTQVWLDGLGVPFDWNDPVLTVDVPAGEHLVELR